MSKTLSPIISIDDARLQHVVIAASAGSGKTHALSGRYLSLLAAGEQPSRILATTFTRAAAGNIRDRLLKRLAEATQDAKARGELAASLGAKSIKPEQAMAMLQRMAGNLHALQIRTLDSFFSSVVRNYAVELGLPPECSVIDENDDRAMRHEALRLMLDERDPQPLIDLLRLLTRGDSDRGVTETIDSTVRALYELWRESDERAWRWIKPLPGLLDEPALAQAIESLAQTRVPADGRFAKARLASLDAARLRAWGKFLDAGLGKVIANGGSTYYKKPIDSELVESLTPLVKHAAAELVHRVHAQTLATATLLGGFHETYDRLKREARVLTFNDLTQAMIAGRVGAGAEGLGGLDDIGYRLDARVHHLLLDEFQDTSGAQWRAIGGMAVEIASRMPPEHTFFCVGDVKQSIYGWRSASPETLERLPALLPGVTPERLDVSWRSSPIVIEAVNAVFGAIGSNAAIVDDPAHLKAGRAWQAAFVRHDVAEKLRRAPGFVQLRTMRPGPEDKAAALDRARLKAAAELAAELHGRDARLRIAILTRTNASVARLLYELGPTRSNVPASGRGGGPLIDAPPVTVILDLLHLADHPDDTVAAFNVANSPLGAAIGFTEFHRRFARWKLARAVRERLMLEGYQRTIADWVQGIAPACDARELRRLTQLAELAGAHEAAATSGPDLRTGPFIEVVENKDVPDSQPAPIEVMTVHQAKGLEFDAVILPDLRGRLTGAGVPKVVFERDERGVITRIARYANKDVRKLLPELEDLTRAATVRAVRESLAVLYVAMTRAKHGLYMLIDPPAGNEGKWPKTHQGVLRGALTPDDCPPGAIVFESGDADWMPKTAKARAEKVSAVAKMEGDATVVKPAPVSIDRSASGGAAAPSPSAMRERALARSKAQALRERLRLTNPEGRERGTVIHALFEQIEWMEEFSPGDEALLAATRAIAPRRDEAWHRRQIAAFRGMIAKPAIRTALSRGTREPGSLIVHREWPFVRIVEGGVQTGIIDRLSLNVDGTGRVTGGTVIDFKTDAIVEGSLEAQAETHREQLQAYREVVGDAFRIDAKRVAMQVLLVGAGAAITL